MIETAETVAEQSAQRKRRRPRWLRQLSIASERGRLIPVLEVAVLILLIGTAIVTYFIVSDRMERGALLPPLLVAGLLVANLVPAMAVMVLVARRIAQRRAEHRGALGGKARLAVRLVAFFSLVASIPTLLVVVFASLLVQSGIYFWFSDQAGAVIDSARTVAQTYRQEQMADVQAEVGTMGGDVASRLNQYGIEDPLFYDYMLNQTTQRHLLESALLSINSANEIQMQTGINLYDRPLESRFPARQLLAMRAGEVLVKIDNSDRIEAVVRLDPEAKIYVYGSREASPLLHMARDVSVGAEEYRSLLDLSQSYQLRFTGALFLVSLLIIAFAIWIALKLADRLVRPLGELVGAARKVSAGDLSARVPGLKARDEVGTLGKAFNQMTVRLQEQTGALISANTQLESRRALIEAVLSGVSAGVIFVDEDHRVRLVNSSAKALLKAGSNEVVGQQLANLSPELEQYLTADDGEDIVQIGSGGEVHTLAVKQVAAEGGHVLTFDDITEQLMNQRRAAWSDVARRIAHEIKNPLTPIQLAAERLQRRYGNEVDSDPATFERLTGTIVRQVGDLRRMVDEFSSFARMPKPVFHEEALLDIARQALFLHEVAHPDIDFSLAAPEPPPAMVCDRRLLGQALTNIVKNGVEAIQQKREEGGDGEGEDRIAMVISQDGGQLAITVTDTGIGLPADRRRLTEPYMTTRTRGTGLGLAIVKKIVEEHFGRIEFEDAAGGGTCVRLVFDAQTLERIGSGSLRISEEHLASG